MRGIPVSESKPTRVEPFFRRSGAPAPGGGVSSEPRRGVMNSHGRLLKTASGMAGFVIACLLVCLACAPRAAAQGVAGSVPNKTFIQVVGNSPPTGSAPSTSELEAEDQAVQVTGPKGRQRPLRAGNLAGSLAAGAVAKDRQLLCFQPGIGWETVLAVGGGGQTNPVGSLSLNASGMNEGSSSVNVASETTATNVGSGAARPRQSNLRRPSSSACPLSSMNSLASAGGTSSASGLGRAQGMASGRPASTMGGSLNPRHAGSLVNPSSSTSVQAQVAVVGAGRAPGIPMPSAKNGGPNGGLDRTVRAAYVSPIKLRRMMRDTHDLQTRIKIREMQKSIAKRGKSQEPESAERNRAMMGRSRSEYEKKLAHTSGRDRMRQGKLASTGSTPW